MEPINTNLGAVHDVLAEVLDRTSDAGEEFGYGLALFARPGRFDALVFGILTRGGESTTLTHRLLQSLAARPVWIAGRVKATIRDAKSYGPPRALPTGLLDQPVLHLVFTCQMGEANGVTDRTMPFESTVFAGELRAPIVLLLHHRPAGWPA